MDFERRVVKKRQKDISGLEEKIISMYAKGMRTRDILAHIKDLYNYEKEGVAALEEFSENWDGIVTFSKYPPEIRTRADTTNPIESSN